MTKLLEERDDTVWYVHAQGRVWGPYVGRRLESFVQEGRVAAGGLVADNPDGPFGPVEDEARLSHLFPPAQSSIEDRGGGRQSGEPYLDQPHLDVPHLGDPQPAEPRPSLSARSAALGDRPRPAEPAGLARPLLVFAARSALEGAVFESALAMHGPFEPIGRGLWLVKARSGPAALRNALSRRLRGEDTLLVVEASLAQVAWFNLDPAEERKLRSLWAE